MSVAYSTADNEAIIRQVAAEFGLDGNMAVAIAMQESTPRLDNRARGDGGHSLGLFQLSDIGEGYGLSEEQRFDPWINSRVALAEVAKVAAAHPDWSPGAIGAAAQRPGNRADYVRRVDAFYAQIVAAQPADPHPAGPAPADNLETFPTLYDNTSPAPDAQVIDPGAGVGMSSQAKWMLIGGGVLAVTLLVVASE